jgi:hypothetical protein
MTVEAMKVKYFHDMSIVRIGGENTCWGPSSSEDPQKHDLTMFSEWIM